MFPTLKFTFRKPLLGNACAMRRALLFAIVFIGVVANAQIFAQNALVLQSDFGVRDGAVAAMKGVAAGVEPNLSIFDLTHEIPPFNIWEASWRLWQTAPYWPAGTVFVSVVDPGVGTARKSVVLKTKTGHFFVTPDNGTLTHVAEKMGVEAVREIDEAVNRRRNSEQSYTFHGRDVYAYTGARLAAGVIDFTAVGTLLEPDVVRIPHQTANIRKGEITGGIPILDVRYGNVWTNIPREIWNDLKAAPGDSFQVKIYQSKRLVFDAGTPFCKTFGEVEIGRALLYLNSLDYLSIALNQADFAEKFGVSSGAEWKIRIKKIN